MPPDQVITETFAPSFSGRSIPRSGLYQKLDGAVKRGRQLICLTTPAGYGKTVLVSSWLQTYGGISVWVSCDSNNHDLSRFFYRLLTSIQARIPGFCSEITPLFPTPNPAEFGALQENLINSFASLSTPVLLCFDDYHLIEERDIHQFLARLIDRLPESASIILISRTRPPLPTARLRVRSQLVELSADDLRFSAEETEKFIQANHGLSLTENQITALTEKTEGWAAAIHLASLVITSGRLRSDPEAFIRSITGNQEYIASFLMDEVFGLQEESIQDFLLYTSVVERFNFRLAAVLSGLPGGTVDSNIEFLERANLFLIPLDTEHHWFRYHHLFSSFLRARLESKRPGYADHLLGTAGSWFLSEGDLEEAVKCALHRQTPDQAVQMILENWPRMLHLGHIDPMINWCKRLPASVFKSYPGLNIAHAWALVLQGYFFGVPSKLELFDRSISDTILSQPDFLPSLEGQRLQIEKELLVALLAYSQNQFEQGLEFSGKAREMAHPDFPLLEGNAWIITGHLYKHMGRVSEAILAFQTGIPMTWKEGNVQATIGAYNALAFLLSNRGDLREATATCQEGIRLAVENHMDETPAAAPLYISLASILTEMDRLDDAETMLNKGLSAGRINHSLVFLSSSAQTQIRLLIARGKPGEALEIAEGVLHHINSESNSQIVNDFESIQSLLQFIVGVKGLPSKRPDPDFAAHFNQFHALHSSMLIYIRALAAFGNRVDALEHLDKGICICSEPDMTGVLIRWLIVRSRVRDAAGDSAGSYKDLQLAHQLGDPIQFVRSFIDEPAYDESRFPANVSIPTYVESCENDMILRLTSREAEILDLIKEGRSNSDIASYLCISLSTVKKHTSSIFRKLGVSSRTQAIVTRIT